MSYSAGGLMMKALSAFGLRLEVPQPDKPQIKTT
jgi:hypothetical protein